MRKRLIGLRLVPLALALVVVLGACGFSTDTVATVGGERITRGELNALIAEVQGAQGAAQGGAVDPAQALDYLIRLRLLELAARDQKIPASSADTEAEFATQLAAIRQGGVQAREGRLAELTSTTLRNLRPVINSYGGAAIPDAELQATVRSQIVALQGAIGVGGNGIAIGDGAPSERLVKDQAVAMRNALAGRGLALPPESLEPTITGLIQQLRSGRYSEASANDDFQNYLVGNGETLTSFRRGVRVQLLLDKLLPKTLNAVVLQSLTTDSLDKANEAVQKGRAGTPFADLIREYNLPTIPTNGPENLTASSTPVEFLNDTFKAAFPSFAVGEISKPLPSTDNKQFRVWRIVRFEQRAVASEQEANTQLSLYFETLRAKYPVTYLDRSLEIQTVR